MDADVERTGKAGFCSCKTGRCVYSESRKGAARFAYDNEPFRLMDFEASITVNTVLWRRRQPRNPMESLGGGAGFAGAPAVSIVGDGRAALTSNGQAEAMQYLT